jgi:hypothetical protein
VRSIRSVRVLAIAAALVLAVSACGNDDSSSTQTSAPEAPSTTIAVTTSASTDTTTGEAPTTVAETSTTVTDSTTAPTESTTATTVAGLMAGGLIVSDVVFADHVTLMNSGDSPMTLDGLWLCNRPAYLPLSGELGPGERLDILAESLGGLAAAGGEVAVYTAQDFANPDEMVDYVAWNDGGGRSQTAAEAGAWPSADATVQTLGSSITLSGPSGDPASWVTGG